MRFEFQRDTRLPPLAWLLTHQAGADVAQVRCGAHVHTAGDVFWEGINPNPAAPDQVLAHHFPLCTGAVARPGAILAFTPGHILDRVFLIERNETLYLSNALPFALAAAGAELAPRDLYMHAHFGAIVAHEQSAPITQGSLRFYHNTNIEIAKDHSVRVTPKPSSPAFRDFNEYSGALHAYLFEIAAAARASAFVYEPASTISSGYDSSAAAVLARSIGARRGFTLTNARNEDGDSDSGEPIGRKLGYEMFTHRRDDYRAAGLEAERFFYVSALPEDIVLYPFKEQMAGALLFSGYKGDTMWDIAASPVGTWSWDPGGATLQSFRLAANFVHLPPAFFGWRRHRDLLAISRSDEMKPWSIGGGYDRPIPRRLLEEAGVPRDWFGMEKRAVSATFGIDKSTYLGAEALGASPAFAALLAEHRTAYGGPAMSAQFAFANSMHAAVRRMHGALYHRANQAPAAPPAAKPSAMAALKAEARELAQRALDWRRPYMTPFTDLCFAAQVANKLMAADYPVR